MKDIIQEAIDNGIPIIDNTKDEAYYCEQRLKRDADKLAKHVFVKNLVSEGINLDPETNEISYRISFDYVYCNREALLSDMYDFEAENKVLKQRFSEQLWNALEKILIPSKA